MKSLVLFTIVFLIATTVYSEISSDSLYAEVDGNQVTLHNISAERNCCAVYEMILTGEEHQLNWLQQSAGDICYCLCYFDLSVTTGPLEPGNYSVDVYYNDMPGEENVFVGTIGFEIEPARFADTLVVLDYSQSTCYNYISLPENTGYADKVYCYPNPAGNFVNFEIDCYSGVRLSILNILGDELWSSAFHNAGRKTISWNLETASGKRVSPGIYFYLFEAEEQSSIGKLIIK